MLKKNFENFLFYFFTLNQYIFYIFRLFWHTNVKNKFLKIKKQYFIVFWNEKHFKKQLLPHSPTKINKQKWELIKVTTTTKIIIIKK
jgi:hypothetical protein